MAINIKDAATEQVARELARESGETLTRAISVAVRERLERVREARRKKPLREELVELAQAYLRLDVIDDRVDDAIIGYDDHGVPR